MRSKPRKLWLEETGFYLLGKGLRIAQKYGSGPAHPAGHWWFDGLTVSLVAQSVYCASETMRGLEKQSLGRALS